MQSTTSDANTNAPLYGKVTSTIAPSTNGEFFSSLQTQAAEKLRELVQKGNLDAIALILKMQPQKIEVTC